MNLRLLLSLPVLMLPFWGQACDGKLAASCTEVADCPSGYACVELVATTTSSCFPECEGEEDCAPGEECSSPEVGGSRVCHPPAPVCDPAATDAECECGTLEGALRVSGQGDDCVVEEQGVSVCAWYEDRCLDGGCTTDYFRYSYPDDSGYLIRRSGPAQVTEGWQRDGTEVDGEPGLPTSCPAAADEF